MPSVRRAPTHVCEVLTLPPDALAQACSPLLYTVTRFGRSRCHEARTQSPGRHHTGPERPRTDSGELEDAVTGPREPSTQSHS